MPKAECSCVLERLQVYASDPNNPQHAVPTLAGPGLAGDFAISRLRVNDWRILFDKMDNTIEVCTVRPRRESYS